MRRCDKNSGRPCGRLFFYDLYLFYFLSIHEKKSCSDVDVQKMEDSMTIRGSERVFQVSAERELSDLHMLKSRAKGVDEKRMREVASEFESLFVNELFKSMRRTVPKNDYLRGGLRQDIFEDMLYQEYARKISHSGGLGLGEMVYKYLLSTQKEQLLG